MTSSADETSELKLLDKFQRQLLTTPFYLDDAVPNELRKLKGHRGRTLYIHTQRYTNLTSEFGVKRILQSYLHGLQYQVSKYVA